MCLLLIRESLEIDPVYGWAQTRPPFVMGGEREFVVQCLGMNESRGRDEQ